MSGALRIREAADAPARRAFLNLPFDLYRGDANWVPPLRRPAAKVLAGHAAFFEHAEMALLLAERSGSPVGRVAAIVNRAHNDYHGDRVGFFGFFECATGDEEAAAALIARAEAWLAERGMETIRGPVSPSMNSTCGLLVDGFDRPPMVLMPYNPPGYAALLEAAGLRGCKDLYAYLVEAEHVRPGSAAHERLQRTVRAVRRRRREVSVRPLDMGHYERDVLRFLGVFEEARKDNWGYVPVTAAEALETAGEMRSVVDPEIILLAEVAGQPAGACLALRNVNRGLAAAGGRLLPLGFLRFARAMRGLSEIRIFGIAALAGYRHLGITAMLLLEVIVRGLAKGYTTGEASWVLDENVMSNRTITGALHPRRYKTYRIYEKPIGATPQEVAVPATAKQRAPRV